MAKRKKTTVRELEAKVEKGEEVIDQHFGKPRIRKALPPGEELERVGKQGHRINVDFGPAVLDRLDYVANVSNVSRQAVIKMMINEGLNRFFLGLDAQDKVTKKSKKESA